MGLVEATDAMSKAANVQILKRVDIGGAFVTTVVQGDVGSVRAAVEAVPLLLSRSVNLLAAMSFHVLRKVSFQHFLANSKPRCSSARKHPWQQEKAQ